MMYSYKKNVPLSYDNAVVRVREELVKEGFGVLMEIDVKATLKKKLNVEFDKYIILGACNPPFAHKALQAEREIGLFLPCNVIVYEQKGSTFLSTVLPSVAMGMIDNDELQFIAKEIETKLIKVVNTVSEV